MHRRQFLKMVPAAMVSTPSLVCLATPPVPRANTVLGERSSRALGMTLMHEHVLVDFVGADKVSPQRYNAEEVFQTALPHLKSLRAAGCRTLVECTPAYLGRDVNCSSDWRALLACSSLPTLASMEPPMTSTCLHWLGRNQLNSWRTGGFGSFGTASTALAFVPGIMKIGVDPGPLSEIDAKLVRGAAKTHLQTGLTIASHTGDGVAALEELEVLKQAGVHPGAFIWVHAQSEGNVKHHLNAAEQGAWVEFDGISEASAEKHLQLVKGMLDQGFSNRVLISQDSGWYHVGEPKGGNYRSYTFAFANFVPLMRRAGISTEHVRALLIDNPRKALTLQVRQFTKTSS